MLDEARDLGSGSWAKGRAASSRCPGAWTSTRPQTSAWRWPTRWTAASGELVLDLAALEAVDATGLGVLVGAHRRAQRAGRTLVLADAPRAVGRLLFLTRSTRCCRPAGPLLA